MNPNTVPLPTELDPHFEGERGEQPARTSADRPERVSGPSHAFSLGQGGGAFGAGEAVPTVPDLPVDAVASAPGEDPVLADWARASSPVPVAPFNGAPVYPTYPTYPTYPGYSNASGYSGYAGYGGGGFPPAWPPASVESPAPRRGISGVFLFLVLLALLIGGVGGAALTHLVSAAARTGSVITVGSSKAPNVSISNGTTTLQHDVEAVATAAEPSVVKITTIEQGGEAVGSGEILNTNGYIVTNDHVVQGGTSFTVTLSTGKSYTATLIGEDPQDDLAVVKISASGLKPITFADSSKAQVGEFVVAVGNPLDEGEAATLGTVSALNGSASEAPDGPAGTLTGLIQTTATINPGNSGGALVDLQGQMLGMPTLEETNPDTRSAAGIGYAISSNRVQYVAQQLISSGQVTSTGQGFLGIEGQDVDAQVAAADGLSVQSGVLVEGFVPDAAGTSPAQQAGLQAGDVITAVNGHDISANSDLATIIQGTAPGSKMTLTIERGTSSQTISVTLGQRPSNAQ